MGAFDRITDGKPTTFVAYRNEESEENASYVKLAFEKKQLNKGGPNSQEGLYVSDDPMTWNMASLSPYLIKLFVSVRMPYVLDVEKSLEELSTKAIFLIKKNGYDSIVSIPRDNIVGTRQMLLLRPNEQVKSLEVVSCNEHLLRHIIREVLDGFGVKSTGKEPTNLRYDVKTTGHTGDNILKDEEQEQDAEKRAAIILVKRNDGEVLCVSRGIGSDQWGLVGGSVESGEDYDDAAVREFHEETGMMLSDPREVFRKESTGGNMTATFIGKVSGEIKGSDEGNVRWLDPSILLDPLRSPFVEYTQELFKKLGIETAVNEVKSAGTITIEIKPFNKLSNDEFQQLEKLSAGYEGINLGYVRLHHQLLPSLPKTAMK